MLIFDRGEKFVDLEKKFEPNLLNSTMYMISMGLQLSTFAVNYKVSHATYRNIYYSSVSAVLPY